MKNKKFMSMLSLAQKAGAIKTGDYAVTYCIQENIAELVIIARNAGANTLKKFGNKSEYYNTDIIIQENKEVLSWAIGKDNVSVLAITDKNFADKIREILNHSE